LSGESVQALRQEADERLLIEAAQRDPARFAELYHRNFNRVYAYVVSRVRDRGAAEDLTSEVFQQALANLGKFEWRGTPFLAWLLRIASNAITDRHERARREAGDPVAEPIDEAALKQVERRAMLYELVDSLPAEQRRVLMWRFTEGKSIRDIAKELQRSEGAVKQLQYRALESLRARVEGAR
jgi:RNA polymerase sigma-70 factor (ECF subfamily)